MTRVLLDTHIAIAVLDNTTGNLPAPIATLLHSKALVPFASVATLWEIMIKHRLGKIVLPLRPSDISMALADNGIPMLKIEEAHVLADVTPEARHQRSLRPSALEHMRGGEPAPGHLGPGAVGPSVGVARVGQIAHLAHATIVSAICSNTGRRRRAFSGSRRVD